MYGILRRPGHGVEQHEGHVLADDCGGLEELLVLRGEPVNPGRQDHLHGRWDLDRLNRPGSAGAPRCRISAPASTSVRMLSSMKKGLPWVA